MIKLRILKWGDYPGLSARAHIITGVLTKGRQAGQRERLKMLATLSALRMEEAATSQGMRQPPQAGKNKGRDSSVELQKEHSLLMP